MSYLRPLARRQPDCRALSTELGFCILSGTSRHRSSNTVEICRHHHILHTQPTEQISSRAHLTPTSRSSVGDKS